MTISRKQTETRKTCAPDFDRGPHIWMPQEQHLRWYAGRSAHWNGPKTDNTADRKEDNYALSCYLNWGDSFKKVKAITNALKRREAIMSVHEKFRRTLTNMQMMQIRLDAEAKTTTDQEHEMNEMQKKVNQQTWNDKQRLETDRIIQAAIDKLTANGISKPTYKQICDDAKKSKSQVARFYKSRKLIPSDLKTVPTETSGSTTPRPSTNHASQSQVVLSVPAESTDSDCTVIDAASEVNPLMEQYHRNLERLLAEKAAAEKAGANEIIARQKCLDDCLDDIQEKYDAFTKANDREPLKREFEALHRVVAWASKRELDWFYDRLKPKVVVWDPLNPDYVEPVSVESSPPELNLVLSDSKTVPSDSNSPKANPTNESASQVIPTVPADLNSVPPESLTSLRSSISSSSTDQTVLKEKREIDDQRLVSESASTAGTEFNSTGTDNQGFNTAFETYDPRHLLIPMILPVSAKLKGEIAAINMAHSTTDTLSTFKLPFETEFRERLSTLVDEDCNIIEAKFFSGFVHDQLPEVVAMLECFPEAQRCDMAIFKDEEKRLREIYSLTLPSTRQRALDKVADEKKKAVDALKKATKDCWYCGEKVVFLKNFSGTNMPTEPETVKCADELFDKQNGHICHLELCPGYQAELKRKKG